MTFRMKFYGLQDEAPKVTALPADKFPMMTYLSQGPRAVVDVYFQDGAFVIEDRNGGDFGTNMTPVTREQLIRFAQELIEFANSVEEEQ